MFCNSISQAFSVFHRIKLNRLLFNMYGFACKRCSNIIQGHKIPMLKSCHLLITILCLFLFFMTVIVFSKIDFQDADADLKIRVLIDGNTNSIMPNNLKGKILPFDQIYESRVVSFNQYLMKSPPRNSTIKFILLWTRWNGMKNTINYYSLRDGIGSFTHYGCPNNNCFVTRQRRWLRKADVVLFHLLDVRKNDLPRFRDSKQIWILYNMEPPWLLRRKFPELSTLNSVFNLTMGYRKDSDIPVSYGFVDRHLYDSRYNFSSIFHEKQGTAVWFSSDCTTDSKREVYVKTLQKYIDVDVYGSCGTMKCFPSQSTVCYDDILQRYMFYLSFENALCKDYVTEKFFNPFNYNIVPVVHGAAEYSRIVPNGTYIDALSFRKPEDLARELIRISSDEKLYVGYLTKKASWKAFLDPWTCRLCDRIHEEHEPSVVKDIKTWFIDDGQCRNPNSYL